MQRAQIFMFVGNALLALTTQELLNLGVATIGASKRLQNSIKNLPHYYCHTTNHEVKWANHFLRELMSCKSEPLDADLGMEIFRQIPLVAKPNKAAQDIIVRKRTKELYEDCIKTANKTGARVSITGNPGIGKTSTLPMLVRMLLEEWPCTVVYELRGHGFFYEFTSTKSSGTDEFVYTAKVIPVIQGEPDHGLHRLKSLLDKNNALVVDPYLGDGGKGRKKNCNPDLWVEARTFISNSADTDHHGGIEGFSKSHPGYPIGGLFRFHPKPEWDEIKVYQRILSPEMKMERLEELFRKFGPNLRTLFDENILATEVLKERRQKEEVKNLSIEMAESIVRGEFQTIDAADKNRPSSSIMAYNADEHFGAQPEVISPAVLELLVSRVARKIWGEIILNPVNFEAYCRFVLSQDKRWYEGKNAGKSADVWWNANYIELGGCDAVRFVADPVVAMHQCDLNTLLHSTSSQHEFVDMVYEDDTTIYAINSTTQKKGKEIKDTGVKTFMEKIKKSETTKTIKVLYLVPGEHLDHFSTDPVNPLQKYGEEFDRYDLSFGIVAVPNPRMEETPDAEVTLTNEHPSAGSQRVETMPDAEVTFAERTTRPTKEQLKHMSRPQLQAICKEHKISRSSGGTINAAGTNKSILAALLKHFCLGE